MSVLTTLALMATALKAAVGREQQAHMKQRASLWPELDGSAEELAKAKARVSELEGDIARANVQYRRDQELIDLWRARALANIPREARREASLPPQPAGPNFPPQQLAGLQQDAAALQRQAQLAQLAQQMQNQNQEGPKSWRPIVQAAMNAQNAYQGGLGGPNSLLAREGPKSWRPIVAQSLIDAELWCNCVPSRAQVWAADGAEA